MQQNHFKTALVALNAQYIHTGLGICSIGAYVRKHTGFAVEQLEYTINHRMPVVLEALHHSQADVYLFSCYIWNLEMVLRLVEDLRQLRPDAHIGLGGPQAGHQGRTLLASQPAVDFILVGEGEETVCQLLQCLAKDEPLRQCPGLVYRAGDAVVESPARRPLSMDALVFPYPDLDALAHRTLYYESMRGCPFA